MFHKVRGHRTTLLNQRCDHLAAIAAKVAAGLSARVIAFERWARQGFHLPDPKSQSGQSLWVPAFFTEQPALEAA